MENGGKSNGSGKGGAAAAEKQRDAKADEQVDKVKYW